MNELENAVLNALLDGDDVVLQILRRQLQQAKGIQREFTGCGFFATFELPAEVEAIPGKPTLTLDDVGASIKGLDNGAGFVLFIKNGLLTQLEGYSYGDEGWPSTIDVFEVRYISGGKRTGTRSGNVAEDTSVGETRTISRP